MNALLALAAVLTLCWLGPTLLDGPSEQQAAEDIAAEVRAIAPQRHEHSAARACAALVGHGATHHWDEDHNLVCTPLSTTPKGNL